MPSKNKLKNLKKQAAQRQGGRCFYCELPMWDDSPREFIVHYGLSPGLAKRFRCTAEHVEARCDGGKDVAPNIVAACLFCNGTRHRAKHPVDAAKHASIVRSRLAKGRWHPPQVKAAFSRRQGHRSDPDRLRDHSHREIKSGSVDAQKRRLAKMYRSMYRSKYRNRAYLSVYWRKPSDLL